MLKKDINKYREIFTKAYDKKDFFKAMIYGEKLLELHKDQQNVNIYEYCVDIYNLAFLNQQLGQIYRACSLCEKSIKFFENSEKFKSDEYSVKTAEIFVDTLIANGICYYKKYSFNQALENFEKAYTIADKHLKKSNKYLNCLHNLGCTYYNLNQIEKAIEVFLIALENRNNKNIDYADNLNFLGYCYEALEDYNQAISYFNQATAIIKGLEGISSQDYMANIYYSATVYEKANQLESSLSFYIKSSNLIEQRLGANTAYFAEVLNKISNVYFKLNQDNTAIELSLKALNITRNIFGESHIFYANNLKKIADIYFNMKDYDNALINYKRETEIKKNIIGETGELYIESLLNLVSINAKIKDLEEFNKLCLEVIDLQKFDLNVEVYEKALLILVQICITYKYNDMLNEIYQNYNNINQCTFDEMINKAENVKGGLFNSINILNNNFDILSDIKNMIDKKVQDLDNQSTLEEIQKFEDDLESIDLYETEQELQLHPSLDIIQKNTSIDNLIENVKQQDLEDANQYNTQNSQIYKKEEYTQENILNLFLNKDDEEPKDSI